MRQRIRAFLIHLTISGAFAFLAVALVFLVWYPSPFDHAVGVTEIFVLVLIVDVVIGPLLTFLVFKEGKSSLRLDLTVIAILQLGAFAYGLFTVAEGRPAWLVYSADRFDLVQVYQIDQRKIDEALAEYRSPPWSGPKWVSAPRPISSERRKDIALEAILAGIDVAQRPELYRPLDEERHSMQEHAIPIVELSRFNPQANVDKVLKKWPEADAYLPMMASAHPVTVLVNKSSAKVVAIVDLNPWE